ncbi:hypothetical protein NL154_31035 (plasmid) [Rhizobium sp. YTUHZ044]|uniref:hypothetical protein n=1 Tax=Rhizobium sp. YTUHZ044 TaxID=2962678 RepID=UPI003DAA484E
MTNTTRHAAESMFKRSKPEQGSDAAKLQDFLSRQALRRRATKLAKMQQRLEKRSAGPVGLTSSSVNTATWDGKERLFSAIAQAARIRL